MLWQSGVFETVQRGVVDVDGVVSLCQAEDGFDDSGPVGGRPCGQIGQEEHQRVIAQEVFEEGAVGAAAPGGHFAVGRVDVPRCAVSDPQQAGLGARVDLVGVQVVGGQEFLVATVCEGPPQQADRV
ncbi:hypothetical protein ABZ682_40955 [Streptomyces griseoviridis]|uniref:hypothetical protein n=1 Tax=Streptomyces TaxID=1883 RepID=UPI0024742853|nr:hypothetical protein [Streptomyces sp. MAA16]MDH6703003.1 hypothetical protein [Streptomyces sp. MAA16]